MLHVITKDPVVSRIWVGPKNIRDVPSCRPALAIVLLLYVTDCALFQVSDAKFVSKEFRSLEMTEWGTEPEGSVLGCLEVIWAVKVPGRMDF